ncbi:hypothetical protein NUSPORA_01236 [Nucleospora cyclopteri]
MCPYDENKISSIDLLGNDKVVNQEEIMKMFVDFVTNYRGTDFSYHSQLQSNLMQENYMLEIQLEHINSYNSLLYSTLVKDPLNVIDACEKGAVKSFKIESESFQVQLVSNGSIMKIREVGSMKSNKIVKISGIVVSCSSVRSKPKKLYVQCRDCSAAKIVSEMVPRQCSSSCSLDPFVIIPEKSLICDVQNVKIQESFEDIPVGETPRHFAVQMENQLANTVSPGCCVKITGVFCINSKHEKFYAYMRATGVEHEKKKIKNSFTEEEENFFRKLSKENIYERISRSIAPGIFGKDDVKKALACMLFGGTSKRTRDNINLRGDINILLLGDPGIAKSQFLKFVEKVSPISVYTSGRGSSAAGLTASVIRDRNNEFYLEGGALVLADRGICCIDEFDKMNETDRVAIHEAMEQQTISIAKAGITTVLNTRTAVLAAANPAFGRYDDYKTPAENIEFGTTILSRFDLIFILRDSSRESDRAVAEHVLDLHAGGDAVNKKKKQNIDNLTVDLLRNYIQYAKARCFPVLGEEAANKLSRFYINIRQEVTSYEEQTAKKPSVPITVRQLEAIIRLSESLARMELSSTVFPVHVDEAIRLFQLSTMSAVSQGHQIEGMVRHQFFDKVAEAVELIKQKLPVGSSARVSELLEGLQVKESVGRKAVEFMVKQNKLISRDYGRVVIRVP